MLLTLKRAHPSGHLSGIVILSVLCRGFVRKPLPGSGAFVNSSSSGWCRPFFNISFKKYAYIDFLDIFINNIFNTYALKKICVVFAPSLPHPTVFFASVWQVASRHRDKLANGTKIINVSPEEFEGKNKQTNKTKLNKNKNTFYVRERLW